MTEYLILFKGEWVPDYTEEEMAERSEAVKALRTEMKAAGVYVFLGAPLVIKRAAHKRNPPAGRHSSGKTHW